jgi:hypothetical protein
MPSSTSASDDAAATRAIVLLLAALVVYFLLLEVAMRTLLPRISEGAHRQEEDYRTALSLRASAPDGSRSLMVVGNSLLVSGIDRQRLRELMGPGYRVALYPIEGTTYLDWAYGLRRLFAEDSRPAVVVLCIGTRHVLSDATNGEGFAYSMMQMRDLPHVVHDSHLDMMRASAYFFAHASAWLGIGSSFRNGLLEKWLPGASLLAAHLAVSDRTTLVANEKTTKRALERLRSMRDLAAENGAKFIYLVPPSLNVSDPAPAIAVAAAPSGVSVLIPYSPGEMPQAAFSDGFHLNKSGAILYTDRVARALREFMTLDGRVLHSGLDLRCHSSVRSVDCLSTQRAQLNFEL